MFASSRNFRGPCPLRPLGFLVVFLCSVCFQVFCSSKRRPKPWSLQLIEMEFSNFTVIYVLCIESWAQSLSYTKHSSRQQLRG